MSAIPRIAAAFAAAAAGAAALATAPATVAAGSPQAAFLSRFHTITTVASTVPFNGDVNPYGTAVITRSTGRLRAGNVLVSNFNNKANLQGTGTTIVQITPGGQRSLFAHITPASCPAAARAGWG